MANPEPLFSSVPLAPLKIAALEGCRELAGQVNKYLIALHQDETDNFLIDFSCPRFGSGEGKCVINESVRGTDLYLMLDVTNYSLTYKVCGYVNHMSPDNHFQDLKRVISAANGKARRINVIMPFLYEGRQHRRTGRESLDSALMLQELTAMGVSNILTFDAHDPSVSNSIPLHGFDSFLSTYQFLKALTESVPNFVIDSSRLTVVSPDEAGMQRAVYFADNLGVNMGMFYRRRDYSLLENGQHPIVAHEFLGDDLKGKDVVVITDMISSGERMLDVAKRLKEHEAGRVFLCSTFGLFTDGLEKFDAYYEKGFVEKVVTTNLNYRTQELLERPYYQEADMSRFLACIIDALNHNVSLSEVQSPTHKIQKFLEKYQLRC